MNLCGESVFNKCVGRFRRLKPKQLLTLFLFLYFFIFLFFMKTFFVE